MARTTQVMPEFEVLSSTLEWLVNEGWEIRTVSPAKGQALTVADQRSSLHDRFGFSDVRFEPEGPDIVAEREDLVWRVECKGMSKSPNTSTHRNNSDRTLASCVSKFRLS